jgi:hypothetical protein
VIAFSGARKVEHFSEVFEKTKPEAALAASILPRKEVEIEAAKAHMKGRDRGPIIIATATVHFKSPFPMTWMSLCFWIYASWIC